MRHNAAARQNNVPSESSFATKSALFGPKNVCPFQILDLTLHSFDRLDCSTNVYWINFSNILFDTVNLVIFAVDQFLAILRVN